MINREQTCGEIIREIMEQAEALLGGQKSGRA